MAPLRIGLLTLCRTGRGRDDVRDPQRRDTSRDITPTRYNSNARPTEDPRPVAIPSSTGSYSSYKTGEDRAAFIRQQAEQRMAERLAALGLKPPSKPGESAQQRQERETRERQDRVRQAEEEDAKREQERQRRLADEQVSPPRDVGKASKKPPPPPVRRNRGDSEAKCKAEEETLNARAVQQEREQSMREQQKAEEAREAEAEQKQKEQAIKDQQAAQEVQTRGME